MESGSSNRNTSGLRTIARPIAHALALAAGKLPWAAVQQRADLQDRRGGGDAALDLGRIRVRHLQPESQIVAHTHMRIERIGLEDHGDAAVGGIEIGDIPSLDFDLAVGDLFQTRDHPQQCRLAAAGRTDEDHEGALGDRQVDAVDHFETAEAFANVGQHHAGIGHLIHRSVRPL